MSFFLVSPDTLLWVPNFPQLDIAYPGNHFHAYATTLELALVYVPHKVIQSFSIVYVTIITHFYARVKKKNSRE